MLSAKVWEMGNKDREQGRNPRMGAELPGNSWAVSLWDTKVGRRKERNGPGFPPDVWRAQMIDGICLPLY